MTEKEKMLNGQMYNPMADKQLVQDRLRCKTLCDKFNKTNYDDTDTKSAILKQIIGKTKTSFIIEPSFWCDYGYNIELGENFYSNHNLVILDCAKVTFGDNVFIGPNSGFYTACHPLNVEERNSWLEFAKPISVGNNVWIGADVTVLPGVTIGDNCTIGAGSVVVKDIPPNSLAVGNPCKVVRNI